MTWTSQDLDLLNIHAFISSLFLTMFSKHQHHPKLVRMQNLRPTLDLLNQNLWGKTSSQCFNKPSRWFWYRKVWELPLQRTAMPYIISSPGALLLQLLSALPAVYFFYSSTSVHLMFTMVGTSRASSGLTVTWSGPQPAICMVPLSLKLPPNWFLINLNFWKKLWNFADWIQASYLIWTLTADL